MPTDSTAALRGIWGACFTQPGGLWADPARLASAERDWKDRRPEHLPLTLAVAKARSDVLEFPRPTDVRGEPTLILAVGYSPEQLALVVALNREAGCRRVVPFSALSTWNEVGPDIRSCLDDLNVDDIVWLPLLDVDPGNPADVFRKIVGWIRQNPEHPLVVDCTGGKKPMDSGAAQAASFYGLPARYLDADDYAPLLRRPYPWSLRYRALDLPDAAFALPSRRRTLEAWRGRRFDAVWLSVQGILEDEVARNYLEDGDRKDLAQLAADARFALAWQTGDYGSDILGAHLLHRAFKASGGRATMEALLSGDHQGFFRCAADECWRLHEQLDAGAYAEALVGAVGLVEFVLDRLVRVGCARSTLKILSADPREWLGLKKSPDLPDLGSWAGDPLPVGHLPPSSFGPKVKLLCKTRGAEFDIWAWHQADGRAELRERAPDHQDERLAVRVTLALAQPPLSSISNRMWETEFGNFPHGTWVQLRHALVHLRAPLRPEEREIAIHAVRVYLPRFLDLLHRLEAQEPLDVQRAGEEGWVTWTATSPWTRAESVPWHGGEELVKNLLKLPAMEER